jgi:hypothetical protein
MSLGSKLVDRLPNLYERGPSRQDATQCKILGHHSDMGYKVVFKEIKQDHGLYIYIYTTLVIM